jgi:hypothetical protein
MKIVFVLTTLVVCFAFVQATEDDYPYLDLPGLAVPNDDDAREIDTEVKANPDPCCFPAQWEGNVTTQAGFSGGRGKGKLGKSSTMVFVDQTNKRIAGRGPTGRFGNETGGFIVVFGTGQTAELYLFKSQTQKCFHKTLSKAEFRPQCIPKNATLDESFSLGPATGGLQVQSWKFCGRSAGSRGSVAFVGGKIIVVPSNCIPVLIQDHGMIGRRPRPGVQTNAIQFEQLENGSEDSDELDRRPGRKGGRRGFVASVFFSNVEPSIKDPAVFTPPSYCNATITNGASFFEEMMPDVLERFISFE